MKLAQWIVCATVILSANTFSFEWDAKQLEAGFGTSWAFYNTEGYGTGPIFTLAAGGSVPILVEQHSRLTGLASYSFAPIYASESGDIGGNYSALNVQVLVEHDLAFGDRTAWAGVGLQGTFSYNLNQFKVLESGDFELIDSAITASTALIGRFEIPLSSVYSVTLTGQYSPLASAYSSVGAAFIMHF